MATPTLAAYDRAVNRGTAVSVIGHLAVLAISVFAAVDTGSTMFWLVALFCAIGIAANVLAWASVRAGKIAWDVGFALLVGSLFVLVWAAAGPGGIALLALGPAFYFMDWLVFKNALKVLRTP